MLLRPRLHGTGSVRSRYQIKYFQNEVALKFMLILHHFTTANHRKNGDSKYARKLAKIDGDHKYILVLSCFFNVSKYISECWPR